MNNDNIVSFVINANAIATSGGNNVNIPNLTELSAFAGVVEIITKINKDCLKN